jgi:hypothetical protein
MTRFVVACIQIDLPVLEIVLLDQVGWLEAALDCCPDGIIPFRLDHPA